jgi:hypothetical protein
MNKNVIQRIQDEDPSYDPLAIALKKTPFVSRKLFDAAADRIYFDGYYGPVSSAEWEEQDGRKPYTVSKALIIVAKVLDNIEDYYEIEYCDEDETDTTCTGHRIWDSMVYADDIKAALVAPWYSEIYGTRYPTL